MKSEIFRLLLDVSFVSGSVLHDLALDIDRGIDSGKKLRDIVIEKFQTQNYISFEESNGIVVIDTDKVEHFTITKFFRQTK